jgi:hypothetical protein
MRKTVFAAIVSTMALTLLSPALAAPELSKATIDYFTEANVSSILNKIGAKNVKRAKAEVDSIVLEFEGNGLPFRAVLTVCKDRPGCLGLLLGIPLAQDGVTFSHDVINGFNESYLFGKAYRAENGAAVVLSRYIIADGGITEANVGHNIAVFAAMPETFIKHMNSQIVASVGSRPSQLTPVMWEHADSKSGHAAKKTPYDFFSKLPAGVFQR